MSNTSRKGVDDQPPNTAKHKSYVGVPSSSAGSLNISGNTRPRRSASLSDALSKSTLTLFHPPVLFPTRLALPRCNNQS